MSEYLLVLDGDHAQYLYSLLVNTMGLLYSQQSQEFKAGFGSTLFLGFVASPLPAS